VTLRVAVAAKHIDEPLADAGHVVAKAILGPVCRSVFLPEIVGKTASSHFRYADSAISGFESSGRNLHRFPLGGCRQGRTAMEALSALGSNPAWESAFAPGKLAWKRAGKDADAFLACLADARAERERTAGSNPVWESAFAAAPLRRDRLRV
jgi:hypothetical protein